MIKLKLTAYFVVFISFSITQQTAGNVAAKDGLASLDAKLDGLKEKLQSLNFMEYAFKMNTFDSSLKTISTNLDTLTKKVIDIEKQLGQLVAGKIQINARSQPAEAAPAASAAIVEPGLKKLEEYGEKMLSVQHSLVTEVKNHAQLSTGAKTLLENGLNKMFVKLDSLLGLQSTGTSFQQVVESVAEIKHTILSTSVGSNSTSERINELYNALKNDWSVIERDMRHMKVTLAEVSRLNNVTEMVQGARIEEVQAVIAKLRKDISELHDTEPELNQAIKVGGQIAKIVEGLGNQDAKILTTNLTATLGTFKQVAFPLIRSVGGGFQLMMDILDKNVSVGASKTLPFMCGGLRFLSMDVKQMERSLSEKLQAIQHVPQCGGSGGSSGNNLQAEIKDNFQKTLQHFDAVAKNLKECPATSPPVQATTQRTN